MNAVPPASVRDHCLTYFNLGWGLVPLREKTKKPYDEAWQHRAITELTDLSRFKAKDNVGVILGKASKLLIDTDGDAPEVRLLADLLPGTRCTFGRVNRGTTHWLYLLAQHVENFTDWVGKSYHVEPLKRENLIELRYQGRQTMLPPSVHPDGDKPFWTTWPPPAPTVVDLRDLEAACRLIAAIILIKRAWPAKNNRDDFAHRVIGGLVYHQVDPDQARMMVARAAQLAGDEEWRGRGDSAERASRKVKGGEKVKGFTSIEQDWNLPGWGRHLLDTLGVASQGVRAATGGGDDQPAPKPKPKPEHVRKRPVLRPWVPFPCEYLPPVMREMVLAVARARNADPALVALPALSAAAACIGAAFQITPNGDWIEECCLWTIPVCESGTRKTPAFSAAMRWLNCEQSRVIREYKRAKREYDRAKDRGEPPEKPEAPPVLLTSDGTIEGITRALASNIRGILYASEEARGWFTSFTRYSNDALSYYLSLYGGSPVQKLRVSGDDSAARPILSVSGAIQPAILAMLLTEQNILSGLLARALIAMPPGRRNPFQRRPEGIGDALERWSKLCESLRGLPWADLAAETPNLIALSDLAADHYGAWHDRLDDRLVDQPANHPATLADCKLWGNVLRIALVHHLCSQVAAGADHRAAVSQESIKAACALGDWFSDEQHRLYPYLGSGEASTVPTTGDRVRAYFDKRPGVDTASLRDLLRSLKMPGDDLTAESLLQTLQELQADGIGTCTTTPAGGRTRVVFTLTPPRIDNAADNEDDPA